ncbi:S-adenosylmethionine:tRNA ribosyltransferase-isomerase [Cytophagales bacterium LB-30]|uniref:S-adenosylmethionine:tRNA ribosyltransferase-isomerase n=1 Tax=Shiella aurantiaca TaxID=3058365 RepID=A0ABT8F1S6_9BACT|nr:S-adenosylmethionine:tRNA ribosyltransferase-isomerase [Shiella aurantiaca]MDN4164333.1 S-adenosylmethionine:tRNA ribosyltransferase-isomerase [Shiella aurantiaca]
MDLQLADYLYDLPNERIAKYPLAQRDQSKLLYYHQGTIGHKIFTDLESLLKPETVLVFNDTKVIPARLHFVKDSGASIELFLLQPLGNKAEITQALSSHEPVVWECMVGNQKRWKEEQSLILSLMIDSESVELKATWHDRENRHIRLSWTGHFSMAEVLEAAGSIPLPPYLHREAEESDKETYQTVYSANKGAVAAPTAGLHFTSEILERLKQKGIQEEFLTLHVGAGTFQPVKLEKNVQEHPMHKEHIVVKRETLERLLKANGPIIPVGTTSMRSLESIYWYGVRLMYGVDEEFFIPKLYPYSVINPPTYREAFQTIVDRMKAKGQEQISGHTEIFIFPGYTFQVCKGLITNFHQPGSTLLMLIAALIGTRWREVYQEAMDKGYRFLSYGDSSLLIP